MTISDCQDPGGCIDHHIELAGHSRLRQGCLALRGTLQGMDRTSSVSGLLRVHSHNVEITQPVGSQVPCRLCTATESLNGKCVTRGIRESKLGIIDDR
jgi:hypothetical protein